MAVQDHPTSESPKPHSRLARVCYIGQLASAGALVVSALLLVAFRGDDGAADSPFVGPMILLGGLLVCATGFGVGSIYLRSLRLRELSRRHREVSDSLRRPHSISSAEDDGTDPIAGDESR